MVTTGSGEMTLSMVTKGSAHAVPNQLEDAISQKKSALISLCHVYSHQVSLKYFHLK